MDQALEDVAHELKRLDPDGSRWSRVIRRTYDMIYNGQETGRYRWGQLMKTEKTHFGTLFEINAQREFEFEGHDSDKTDYRIAGHLVDAKWSQERFGWMLPPEVVDELALVATGSDQDSVWSLGLVRVLPEFRAEGANRDKKSKLNAAGRNAVTWIFQDAPLRPNVLLQLDPSEVDHIFNHRHGTQRTNRLFRAAEGRIVHRNAVATVSRQLDAQKRVRYNGGARSALAAEGYLILSGQYHSHFAERFQLPIPERDEYVSVRIVPAGPRDGQILIAGRAWRRARPDEVVVEPAPRIVEIEDLPIEDLQPQEPS